MHSTIGRPSGYTDDIATSICTEIAAGLSLREIAHKPEFPSERAIYAWLVAHEPFQQMYARAREQRVERWADEIVELADAEVPPNDNAAVQRARLRVDTRKWLMSKLAPRKYGDRVEHVIKSGNAADLTDDELARIAMAAAPALLAAPLLDVSSDPTPSAEGEQDQ